MKRLSITILLLSLIAFFSGCATTSPENQSERPWNAQRGWEHGLPSTINEGR